MIVFLSITPIFDFYNENTLISDLIVFYKIKEKNMVPN